MPAMNLKQIRKQLKLSHDVLRHTFISKHIGAFKSFADAAIESGNSEKIIRDHYLNTSSLRDAKQFWKIEPKLGLNPTPLKTPSGARNIIRSFFVYRKYGK
jgi:hypothetical protein